MANRRVSMRTLEEVLRLHGQAGLACGDCPQLRAVPSYGDELLTRAGRLGLASPVAAGVEEAVLVAHLYPDSKAVRASRPSRISRPSTRNCRHKGVTLNCSGSTTRPPTRSATRIVSSVRATAPGGVRSMSRSAGPMSPARSSLSTTLATRYGQDPVTGQVRAAQILVAVQGARAYTSVEARFTQDLPSLIGAHTRALAFFLRG